MPKTPFERNGKMCAVVRRERQKLGLTQEQLADRIGVQKNTIGLIERDKTGMRKKTADDLMHLFECDDLYLRGESPYKSETDRRLARISNFRDEINERHNYTMEAISKGAKWEIIGTVGMCIDYASHQSGDSDNYSPRCYGISPQRDIPDGSIYRQQYYVFDTPGGERVISCLEFEKFVARTMSLIRIELENLAEHVPVLAGWEKHIPAVMNDEFRANMLIRFFDNDRADGFNHSSEWGFEKLLSDNRQQDNEKKGEEQ